MDNIEQLIREWADRAGYQITRFHDGLCDFQDLRTGMTSRDVPLDDALAYFKWPERYAAETDALLCSVDLTTFDVYGVIPYKDKYRPKRRAVCLLHAKTPRPLPWALKTPDGTRSFHDFFSMMDFAISVYGRKKALTPKQYAAALSAYREHVETGSPFAMPKI